MRSGILAPRKKNKAVSGCGSERKTESTTYALTGIAPVPNVRGIDKIKERSTSPCVRCDTEAGNETVSDSVYSRNSSCAAEAINDKIGRVLNHLNAVINFEALVYRAAMV